MGQVVDRLVRFGRTSPDSTVAELMSHRVEPEKVVADGVLTGFTTSPDGIKKSDGFEDFGRVEVLLQRTQSPAAYDSVGGLFVGGGFLVLPFTRTEQLVWVDKKDRKLNR